MRLFSLCSAHCKMRNIATTNENFGIQVAYMTWTEQSAIEIVDSTGISVRNIYPVGTAFLSFQSDVYFLLESLRTPPSWILSTLSYVGTIYISQNIL